MPDSQTVITRSDRTMFFAMCGMIFFIPISSALVEWMFGISMLAFLSKRFFWYRLNVEQQDLQDNSLPVMERLKVILRHFKPLPNCVNKPVAVFCGWVIISSFFGLFPWLSLQAFVFKVLQGFFTAFLFMEAVSTRQRLKQFFCVFLFSMTLININGIFQYITGEGFMRHREIYYGRLMSSFRHPNDYAAYLIGLIPILFSLSVCQFFDGRKGRDVYLAESDTSGFFASKSFMLSGFMLLLFALYSLGLTYSRGGWLACGICLFIMLIKKPKLLGTFVIAGGFGLLVFLGKMLLERSINIDGSITNIFFNFSDRGGNWRGAFQMIKDHPIFGVGLNNYTFATHDYDLKRYEYPHNCYLQMAAEIGTIGLALFGWILVSFFKDGIGKIPRLKERLTAYFLPGVLAGLGAFLIQSFFDTNFYSTQLGAYMWVLVGLGLSIPRIELKE